MKPSELTPEEWLRVDSLFDRALDLPRPDRAQFVKDEAAGDHNLLQQVQALLEAHEATESEFAVIPESVGRGAVTNSDSIEGKSIGPFTVIKELGRGGMGVVYMAKDQRLGRTVALKVLPAVFGSDPGIRERFVAEARAVSALSHDNIVTLHEINSSPSGQPYMVFEYYDGETLEDRIRRGPIPLTEAVEIALGIAAGLEAAHSNGIVHCDVKPSNVLITSTGRVKLLDFGIARAVESASGEQTARFGTAAYMSPEQALGHPIDYRADLWSLGVVIYEMLSAERPFAGDDRADLVRAITSESPTPLRKLGVEVPDGVQRLLDLLLKRDPAERPESAQALSTKLTMLIRRRRTGRAVIVVTAAVLVTSVMLAMLWKSAEDPEVQAIHRLAVLPFENLSLDPEQRPYAEGIHEALISELGAVGSVEITSKSSIVALPPESSLSDVGRILGVDAVVKGSILRQDDSVTVMIRLVGIEPERQLWSTRYRRRFGSIPIVVKDATRSIAQEIRLQLDPSTQARLERASPVNPEAYDAYLHAQVHTGRLSSDGFREAFPYYRRAIELDSTFAPAYLGLANMTGATIVFGMSDPSTTCPQVRSLVAKAVALDSTLSDAQRTAGAISYYCDWNWDKAESQVRRAIELNRSLASAHRLLSEILATQGQHEAALESVERARQFDRLAPVSNFMPALSLYLKGDYRAAIERASDAHNMHPGFWQGHWLKCLSLAALDQLTAAVNECRFAVDRSGRTTMALGALGYVLAQVDSNQAAHRIVTELENRANVRYVGASYISAIYGALSETDRAFEWMQRAYDDRDVTLVHANDYTFFDPLRDEPRFRDLMHRMDFE